MKRQLVRKQIFKSHEKICAFFHHTEKMAKDCKDGKFEGELSHLGATMKNNCIFRVKNEIYMS